MAKREISKYQAALINDMKSVMEGIESTKGDGAYSSLNITKGKRKDGTVIKPTYAMGYYQFLPSLHLDNIVKFAKKGNYGFEDYNFSATKFRKLRNEGKELQIRNNLSKIMNSKVLQDDFFAEWMLTEQLPSIQKTYELYGKNNGLSVHDIMALSHIKGTKGARDFIKKAEKNPELWDQPMDSQNKKTPSKYIKSYRDAWKSKGILPSNPEKIDEDGEPQFVNMQKRSNKLQYLPNMETVLNNCMWEQWTVFIQDKGVEEQEWNSDQI